MEANDCICTCQRTQISGYIDCFVRLTINGILALYIRNLVTRKKQPAISQSEHSQRSGAAGNREGTWMPDVCEMREGNEGRIDRLVGVVGVSMVGVCRTLYWKICHVTAAEGGINDIGHTLNRHA